MRRASEVADALVEDWHQRFRPLQLHEMLVPRRKSEVLHPHPQSHLHALQLCSWRAAVAVLFNTLRFICSIANTDTIPAVPSLHED